VTAEREQRTDAEQIHLRPGHVEAAIKAVGATDQAG
jgi:hypothetical protein